MSPAAEPVSPLRDVAIAAALDALLDQRWHRDVDGAGHREHRYHGECAVCIGDVGRMVPVALDAADRAVAAVADPQACPHAVTGDEGTSYCAQAEEGWRRAAALAIEVRDLRARLDAATGATP